MNMKFKKFLVCILPVLVISLVYVVAVLYQRYVVSQHMPCWFNLLTGYLCPGCGGTRSLYALLRGDILSSFRYNAFVPTMSIFGMVVYVRLFLKVVLSRDINVLPKNDNYVYVPLVGFLVYFFVRNLFI